MWTSVKETTGVNMAAKTFLVATDVAAHKDMFSIISGINVWVRKQNFTSRSFQNLKFNISVSKTLTKKLNSRAAEISRWR